MNLIDSKKIFHRTRFWGYDKLNYDQLISEGERADSYKETNKSKVFFQRACELKKESYGCIMYAYVLYPSDQKVSKGHFESTCTKPKISDENIKRMCDAFVEEYLSSENH